VAITRVFQSGNSQAVRLPKEFRFDGPEVDIFRRGEEVVLRERKQGMARAFELIASLPEEIDQRDKRPPQDREGL
jgi:antitoxin VapB